MRVRPIRGTLLGVAGRRPAHFEAAAKSPASGKCCRTRSSMAAQRASLSDEAWVEWGALDDDAWYARLKADFGMDARPEAG